MDFEPTVKIKEETISPGMGIVIGYPMNDLDPPSPCLGSRTIEPEVREETDYLHGGTAVVIKKEQIELCSSTSQTNLPEVNDTTKTDISRGGCATLIFKDELIVEEPIAPKQKLMNDDCPNYQATPSTSLRLQTNMPEVTYKSDIVNGKMEEITDERHILKILEEMEREEDCIEQDLQLPQFQVDLPPSTSGTGRRKRQAPAAQEPAEVPSKLRKLSRNEKFLLCDLPDDVMEECLLQLELEDDLPSMMLGGTPSACHICGYKTQHRGDLKRHIRTHTGEKPYTCDSCDYRTSEISHLKRHSRTHTGEKRFACDSCDYKTAEFSQLEKHLRTHTGEKPYACGSCDYRASQIVCLKSHIMHKHTGEKPFACDSCDYRAIKLCNLKRHMRTHTGEKPYACDNCDYRAALLETLRTHMKTHTGEKPYACNSCDYKSARLYQLNKHLETHAGQPDVDG